LDLLLAVDLDLDGAAASLDLNYLSWRERIESFSIQTKLYFSQT